MAKTTGREQDMAAATTTRRRLLRAAAAVGAAGLAIPGGFARASILRDGQRIAMPAGVQTGDILPGRAMLWAKADRPGRMLVRWSTTESFGDARHATPVHALEDTDCTAKLDLTGLPPGQRIFYEVRFLDLADLSTLSEPTTGSLLTPPGGRRPIRFVWSGDTAGQGWGINPDLGGMPIYETMRQVHPDFFIHSGDTIYADNPILPEVTLADGTTWKNITTEAKAKVAETLAEFRGNYAYNLLDDNLRRFNAEVPMLAQWDDHEVTDNWYWELRKDADERYREGSVALLAARAMRAFHDYMPTRRHPLEQDRLYTSFRYGPSLEVFRIDMRAYRGPNSDEQPTALSPEARILGEAQTAWLKQALKRSTATWKVIAAGMPLGLVVYDDWRERRGAEAIALRDGPPAGREVEIAGLLTFIRDQGIKNTVWLTADVHYTAAHHYRPENAQYQAFAPFWEFVSGPLHAGTFGPNRLDDTFGPVAVFVKAPPEGQFNLPPSAGLQFFGQIDIEPLNEVMTVRLKDQAGQTLFTQDLVPEDTG
jgi:alkaline phosphatase D